MFIYCLCAFSQSKTTAIKCGTLVDGTSEMPKQDIIILIEDNRIAAVGHDIPIPQGAALIDLSNATVLPGLIDCHTHLSGEIENYLEDTFRKSAIDYSVEAHIFALRTLEAGFTTCRDVGAGEFIDVALKKAINAGKIPGPRLIVAGLALSATGGHGDLSGFSPYLSFQGFNGVVDGVGEIRKKIRFLVKNGADVIKFTATAGVLSEEESAGAPQFSFDEMKAIVDEAAMWGRKVAAHAHGAEGIKMAVNAGVASIEHGSLIDGEGIALMKARGTYLVPTVYVGKSIEIHGAEWNLPEKVMNKARMINAAKRELLSKAIRAGVRIAYGTDVGVFAHGKNAKDFALLVDAGMTPMQAIKSATVEASKLLGWEMKIGSIEQGKLADIVAIQGNPLENISLLEHIGFVMKDGKVYKNEFAKK